MIRKASLMGTLFGLAGLLLAAAGGANAATTVGQAAPAAPVDTLCGGATLFVQQQVAPASPTYVVPAGGGVLTQWAAQGGDSDSTLELKVVNRTAPATYQVVASDVVQTITANVLNSFPIRIPVSGGELVALWVPEGNDHPCGYSSSNSQDAFEFRAGSSPEPSVGDTFVTDTVTPNERTNVEARLEPDGDHDGFGDESQDKCLGTAGTFNGCPNTVTIDSAKQKGKKPKITVTATVPGAGGLKAGSANDASLASASGGKSLKAVSRTITSTTRQQVTLTLKLTKSAKKKLTEKGKLKTKVKVVYTPTGGPPGSQTRKVKLSG